MNHLPDYEHVKCKCGGIIGMRDGLNFTCGDCGSVYHHFDFYYDRMMINSKTGWMFPVTDRENKP